MSLWHYAQVLIIELVVNNVKSIPPACMKANKTVEKIVSNTVSFLESKFNLKSMRSIKNFLLNNGLVSCIKILRKEGL